MLTPVKTLSFIKHVFIRRTSNTPPVQSDSEPTSCSNNFDAQAPHEQAAQLSFTDSASRPPLVPDILPVDSSSSEEQRRKVRYYIQVHPVSQLPSSPSSLVSPGCRSLFFAATGPITSQPGPNKHCDPGL